jgi:hypothetical protein
MILALEPRNQISKHNQLGPFLQCEVLDVEQITKADRNASHALCRTERTEHSEFMNEMSNRAHESPQVANNGKACATLRRLSSTVLLINTECRK